jgi:hypothetical protein
LEKTWGMLDWLPRPELPAEFASQTITRIHSQRLDAERLESRFKRGVLLACKATLWLACVMAMATIGFAVVRHAWPDPNRDLVNHLDILENLDTYRAIPDSKFLEDLNRLGIFVEQEPVPGPQGDVNAGAGAVAPAQAPSP